MTPDEVPAAPVAAEISPTTRNSMLYEEEKFNALRGRGKSYDVQGTSAANVPNTVTSDIARRGVEMRASSPLPAEPPHIHTYTRTHTHTHLHLHTYTKYAHTCIHIHTYTRTYIQTYTHTHVHTYTRTRIHTQIHAYIHTYTHARIHKSTQTHSPKSLGGLWDTRNVRIIHVKLDQNQLKLVENLFLGGSGGRPGAMLAPEAPARQTARQPGR